MKLTQTDAPARHAPPCPAWCNEHGERDIHHPFAEPGHYRRIGRVTITSDGVDHPTSVSIYDALDLSPEDARHLAQDLEEAGRVLDWAAQEPKRHRPR